MTLLRVAAPVCALVALASARPVAAQPCCPPTVRYYAPARCCDPCPPVGPVRRLLRRVFRPCCPPPRPCPPVIVPAPVVIPNGAPRVFVPPAPPPAVIERPIPADPTQPPPGPPVTGSSYRPAPLTPPVPPPPVRLDRTASLSGGGGALA
jgi:hypothetical protein